MKFSDVMNEVLKSGGSVEEVAAEAKRQKRQAGSVPHRNMIRALEMFPMMNTPEEWVRLAAAKQVNTKAYSTPAKRQAIWNERYA